jgi:hypothetical protein
MSSNCAASVSRPLLLVHRADHVGARHLELREAVGPHPDPHRVILRPEDLNVGRARDTLHRVEHVERHVVRDLQIVEAAVGRGEREHLEERR